MLRKTKSKTLICIDLEPLMTNITISLSSVSYLTAKKAEITDITELLRQLYNENRFSGCVDSYTELLLNCFFSTLHFL